MLLLDHFLSVLSRVLVTGDDGVAHSFLIVECALPTGFLNHDRAESTHAAASPEILTKPSSSTATHKHAEPRTNHRDMRDQEPDRKIIIALSGLMGEQTSEPSALLPECVR